MTYLHPGIDTGHIIRSAVNSKSLAQLGREEDTFQARKVTTQLTKEQKLRRDIQEQGYERASGLSLPYGHRETVEFLKDKSPDEILAATGIDVFRSQDGSRLLASYSKPDIWTTFADLGVDEAKLIEGASKILGDCNLRGSSLKNLGDISSIQGDLVIGKESKIKDLSSIKELWGCVIIQAGSKAEAIQMLQKMNFHPKKFTGKIINI